MQIEPDSSGTPLNRHHRALADILLSVHYHLLIPIEAAADFHFASDHGANFNTPAVDAVLARSQHEDLGNAPFIADDC
jgi:hypothetical protein